jgi:hypothetical protein
MPSDLVSEQTNDSEKVAIQPQEGLKNVTPGGMPRLVNGLLGGFLEGDEAPTLTAALSAPTTLEGLKDVAKGLAAEMMQLVNSLISGIDGEGQPFAPAALEELKELAKGLAAAVIQLVNSLLGGPGGEGQHNSHDGQPFPPVAPAPAPPVAPPASGASFNAASGASGNAFVVLLGVFALFTLLLRGGKFSWPSHEFIKPPSALRPAIERPG